MTTLLPLPRGAGRRRLGRVAIVIGVVVLVALAARLLVPQTYPSSRLVGWKLNYGYNGPGFKPAEARTTTVVPVEVNRSSCAPADLSWLAPPTITYTPQSVTITLHTTDAFGDTRKCNTPDKSGRVVIGDYLSGIYLAVQLSEPLGGRGLFDGSTSPATARPYP